MENLKLAVEDLFIIRSALEDAEIVERRRSILSVQKGDIACAIYHDEKADSMKGLSELFYTCLHGKAEKEV